MVCGTIALRFINYPTQVIAKSSKPIPVMVIIKNLTQEIKYKYQNLLLDSRRSFSRQTLHNSKIFLRFFDCRRGNSFRL